MYALMVFAFVLLALAFFLIVVAHRRLDRIDAHLGIDTSSYRECLTEPAETPHPK